MTHIEKMTPSQLEQRIRFHRSTADNFERHQMPTMARKFREMARKYQVELDRRDGEKGELQ